MVFVRPSERVCGQQLLTISFTLKYYFNFETTTTTKLLPREIINLSSHKGSSFSCHSLNALFFYSYIFIYSTQLGTATNICEKIVKITRPPNSEGYNKIQAGLCEPRRFTLQPSAWEQQRSRTGFRDSKRGTSVHTTAQNFLFTPTAMALENILVLQFFLAPFISLI